MATNKGNTKQTGKVTKLNEKKRIFMPAEETQDSTRPSERAAGDNTGGSGNNADSKSE